jgi:hypothetical protein
MVRSGVTLDTSTYLTRDAGIESLEEIVYLDGKNDLETIIKRLDRPCGSANVGTGSSTVTTPHDGYGISFRAESNLKLCVFYLKHQAGVTLVPTAGGITLEMVCGFKYQQRGGWTTRRPKLNL